MPNLSDIAREAGVSISTVSRALRSDKRISENTIKKVYEAAMITGYIKHIKNETVVMQNHEWMCIGIIVPEVISGYYARLVHLAAESFKKHDYLVTIRLTNFDHDTICRHVNDLCYSNVDCLLIIADDSEEVSGDIFSLVSGSGKPAFFITSNYISNNDFDSLYIDERRGIDMLLEHLADKNYKKIGFIGELQTIGRRDAYINSMKRLKLPINEKHIKIHNMRAEAGGYLAMQNMLAEKEYPDAVFFSYDQMAFGGMKAIKEAGLTIPGDIAIAAFDDIIISEYIADGLTTVQSPCEDMITIATRVLLSRVKDKNTAPQQIALKPKLIVRGTT